jgi:Na+/H+ antiporter NhaD/arsenite permease-like protein
MNDIWIVSVVFIFTYFLIANEKIRITKPTAALSGAMMLISLKVISQEEAIEYIDFNTIGLLIGMMIIVGVIKKTGLFQYVAIKAAKLADGQP